MCVGTSVYYSGVIISKLNVLVLERYCISVCGERVRCESQQTQKNNKKNNQL